MSPNTSINPYGRLLNHTTVSVKDRLLTAPFNETLSCHCDTWPCSVHVLQYHFHEGWVSSKKVSNFRSVMDGEAPVGFEFCLTDGWVCQWVKQPVQHCAVRL